MEQLKRYIIAVLLLSFFHANSQRNAWKLLTVNDGLVSNKVQAVYAENDSAIWIGTNQGLSFYNGKQVSVRFINGLSLNEQNIRKLLWAQNKLWALTNSGVSSLENGSWLNYDQTNGLPTNDITDIAADELGKLWIASRSGVSVFDGNNFTHHDSIKANFIGIDTNNRVYVVDPPFLISNVQTVKIFDGGIWQNVGTPASMERSEITRLFRAEDGRLIAQCKEARFFEMNFPFNPIKNNITFPFLGSASYTLAINQNRLWAGTSSLGPSFLHTEDSLLSYFNINVKKINTIELKNDYVYVGSDFGLVWSNQEARPLTTKTNVKLQNFSLSLDANQGIFQQENFSNKFEIKGFGGAIFSSEFVSVVKEGRSWRNNPDLFGDGALRGPKNNNSIGFDWPYIVQVSQNEIDQHRLNFSQVGYIVPENISNWPANGDSTLGMFTDLAPYKDVNNNGCYDPQSGDYPIIKGDIAVFWIRHSTKASVPFEYHYLLYAFEDSTDQDLSKSIFLDCRIINRSQNRLDSIKTGYFVDWDLGDPRNDYTGCDSLNNSFYVYNADSVENILVNGSPLIERNIPFVGAKFLSDSLDSYMTLAPPSGQTQINLEVHYWLQLNAIWINGISLKYGGNGQTSTSNIRTRYAYTGNPFAGTGWTEANPSYGLSSNAAGDRRGFGSIPYYSLNPGESKTISVAIGYGRKDSVQSHLENFPEMQRVLKHAANVWNNLNNSTPDYSTNYNCTVVGIEEEALQTPQLTIFPNPTKSSFQIKLEDSKRLSSVLLYDLKGQLIREYNGAQQEFSVASLPHGLYLIRVHTEQGEFLTQKLMIQ